MEYMLTHFLHIIGYLFIWLTIDYGRKKEDKIKFLSKQWFVVFGLIILATTLIKQ